ncbi:DMT family transporter [Mesobacterium pallidum]|uniref:DMT family transporter n=1 Tax=Mesobacterium pallidum TaxID=2872037 RepID=UPI001EE16A1E|nr:DMT family transporter [Mesobacterium pallidum]
MSHTLKAALWMTGAIASFSSMAVAGRAVSFELDTFEIMMYRSLVGVVLVLTVSTLLGTRSQIRATRLGTHAIRNLGHFAGQNLWFYAITVVPLAQVFSVEFTAPIWAMLMAVVILGEALTRARIVAAGIGFVGILVVARPWGDGFDPNIVFPALAAIGFAVSAVFTRLLTRTETITTILFWLTAMQAVFGLVCAGFDGDIALPSATTAPWLALIACAGLVAHLCLTKALSLAPASVVMPIDFARLPVIAIVGMVLYDEPLDPWVILGAALIFGGNYYNILNETRRNRIGATPA